MKDYSYLSMISLPEFSDHPKNPVSTHLPQHLKTSQLLLESYSLHPEEEIRASTAMNYNISLNALHRLGRDKSVLVRAATTLNPRAPESIKRDLSRERVFEKLGEREVGLLFPSSSSTTSYRTVEPFFGDLDDVGCHLLIVLLGMREVPEEVAERFLKFRDVLTKEEYWKIQSVMAMNLTTPKSVLDALGRMFIEEDYFEVVDENTGLLTKFDSVSVGTVFNLLTNPNTSSKILFWLKRSRVSESLGDLISAHPNYDLGRFIEDFVTV